MIDKDVAGLTVIGLSAYLDQEPAPDPPLRPGVFKHDVIFPLNSCLEI
jgi:hypothetical protein